MAHWGWLIAIYLFLGGLGAGAYLASFAAEKGILGSASSLKRVGYYAAAPIVAFGALLLVFDLGQGFKKPWLILGMFLNLHSVMTWGIYILSAFILIGLIKGYFTWKNKKAPEIVTYMGAVLAIATASYTGLLLSVVEAVPFWNNFLMPVLFVISAFSTGLSSTSLLAHFFEREKAEEGRVCRAHMVLVSAEMIVLITFFSMVLSGTKGEVAILSAQKMLSGSLALAFWVLMVGIGLFIPFLLYAYNSRRLRRGISLIPPESITTSAIAESTHQELAAGKEDVLRAAHTICACDGAVIVGGLTLRCLIIFAALPAWNGFLG